MSKPTANTTECFKHFVGERMTGFIIDDDGAKMMIFEGGKALCFHSNGGYYIIDGYDVTQLIKKRVDLLREQSSEIRRLSNMMPKDEDRPL